MVGAGAVENAWQPVIRALQPGFTDPLDGDGAYCALARSVYLARFYATWKGSEAEEKKAWAAKYLNEIKQSIATALRADQKAGLLRTRKELLAILHKFIFSEIHQSVLISANWDTVVDQEINRLGESNYPKPGSDIKTLHIHGSIDEPTGLYLPSEVVREAYRTEEEDLAMGNLHGSIWQTIEQCHICVVYGLSLDPLDAELSQTLVAGWSNPNLQEVIIINPSHEKVANRAKFMLDERYPAKITGYHPAALDKPVIYKMP